MVSGATWPARELSDIWAEYEGGLSGGSVGWVGIGSLVNVMGGSKLGI